MAIRQRIAVILCLGIGLASSGLTVAQSSPGLGQEMSHADREPPGLHDFDFLFGRWQVHKESSGAFRFERKVGATWAENIYFSQAPLRTQEHIGVLEELEEILSSS